MLLQFLCLFCFLCFSYKKVLKVANTSNNLSYVPAHLGAHMHSHDIDHLISIGRMQCKGMSFDKTSRTYTSNFLNRPLIPFLFSCSVLSKISPKSVRPVAKPWFRLEGLGRGGGQFKWRSMEKNIITIYVKFKYVTLRG